MKKGAGIVFIFLGLLSVFSSTVTAKNAKEVAGLMGSYVPGIFFILIGSALRQEKKSKNDEPRGAEVGPVDSGYEKKQNLYGRRSELGILGGIVVMLMSSGLSQIGADYLLFGLMGWFAGWMLFTWGCCNFMMGKGYSPAWGLLGLLLLPGLIILACFPKKKKKSIAHLQAVDDISAGDS